MNFELFFIIFAVIIVFGGRQCSCPKEEVLDKASDVPTYFG